MGTGSRDDYEIFGVAMKSILQQDESKCYLCGRRDEPLERHHVFFGAFRQRSEEYGLTVKICALRCHREGENAVHRNSRVCRSLQRKVQAFAMGYYGWTMDEWREKFGKSYLGDEVEVETNIYDQVEEHHNCFVQILTNSRTGEVSIGWREEYE